MNTRGILVIALVFGAAALRLLPHPVHFTPIWALALFAGAQFENKRWAFGVPLVAMFLSDVVIGFHSQMPLIYAAFAVIVCMGFMLKEKRTILRVTGAAVAASTFFFIVSNFSVWVFDGLYPLTLEGLAACYVAAIPFYQNSVVATLFYSAVLFGSYALAERTFVRLAPAVN